MNKSLNGRGDIHEFMSGVGMNLKLTAKDIAAIERREQNATPGPWGVDKQYRPYSETTQTLVPYTKDDITFNVSNRTDVPNLVHDWRVLSQRVAFLEARNAELEKVLEWYAETGEPGEFSIVDENRQYISDFHGWGRKAREVLNKN